MTKVIKEDKSKNTQDVKMFLLRLKSLITALDRYNFKSGRVMLDYLNNILYSCCDDYLLQH